MALQPFIWGQGGAITTPEAAARQRAVAEALIGRSATPASNWAEGLSHLTSAFTGSQLQNRAMEAEEAGRVSAAEALAGLGPEAGFSDIAAALSNPWLSGPQSTIASALLQQNLQRQDPMYAIGLERAQLELDALRNPQPDLTDTQRNLAWRAAEAGLVPGSPGYTDFMISGGSGPQIVNNVGGEGQRIGSVPAGYAVVEDPTNPSGFRYEMIPNSPAALEAQAAQEQAAMRGDQAGRYADVVLDDIDHALGLTGGDTTGILGTLLQQVPGTNARNLDALLQTIRSNIGFDRLQAMREASPTGGALGAVSDFENRQLQSTLGNLEQSQTEEQLRRNLERVRETYLDIIHGPGNRPDQQGGMPSPGQVIDGYRYVGGDPANPQSWEQVR